MRQKRNTKAIARMWHGVASKQHLPRILEHLSGTRLRGTLDAQGNLGGLLLSRESNGAAEIFILTLWESEQAIRRLVGDNIHAPMYRPGDEQYVVGKELTVKYFDAEILKIQGKRSREPETADSRC